MDIEFHKDMVEVQQSLKAPKDLNNNFGGYKYRSCESILEALKPILKDKGLVVSLSDEVVNIGQANYVKATATISDGTNHAAVTAYAREAVDKKGMDEAQITGAASSYARKYALNGLLAIDDTKDADSQDNTQHVAKAPGKPSDKQVNYARELMVQHGFTGKVAGEMIELFIGKKVPVSSDDYSKLISALKDYKPAGDLDLDQEPNFDE